MSDDPRLGDLAQHLPWRAPDAARRQSVRDAIVLEAQTIGAAPARRPRRAVLIGAGAAVLAAAAAIAFVLGGRAGTPRVMPVQRGTVQASSAADFVHSAQIEHGINDEVVRLRGGRVSVSVDPLRPDQRFRVVAGDGEVEVRGTAFEVLVVADRLEAVVVQHGLVEVRLGGELVAKVAGGEQWTRAAVARAPTPAPAPAPAPARRSVDVEPSRTKSKSQDSRARAGARAEEEASVTEGAFRAGRAALRSGDFAAAADQFARAIEADPDAPLAEDARYWRGVALGRAGRDADAIAALTDFLGRHATSLHAGRASLALGNLLLRAGDITGARTRFDAARHDDDPAVSAAAEKALAALPE